MTNASFLAALRDYPNQFTRGIKLARAPSARVGKRGFDNVVTAGMGGSTWPIDFVNVFLESKPRIAIHRDYGLPTFPSELVNKKTLFLAISYSGNTEETIDATCAALARSARPICIACGGQLERLAAREKLAFIKLPPGLQPRCATGYIFSTALAVLTQAGLTRDHSRELYALALALEKRRKELEKQGEKIARELRGAIPLVFSSSRWESVARSWTIKFNEHSKIPSFHGVLPEANHNTFSGFAEKRDRKIARFHVVFLRDAASDARILKRFAVTRELLRELGVESSVVEMKGASALEKMFSTVWLGDFVAYHLALSRGVDPEQVPIVEYFKKKLKLR